MRTTLKAHLEGLERVDLCWYVVGEVVHGPPVHCQYMPLELVHGCVANTGAQADLAAVLQGILVLILMRLSWSPGALQSMSSQCQSMAG